MALIDCPDCGKQHSDLAAACPNCARPSKPRGESAAPPDASTPAVDKGHEPPDFAPPGQCRTCGSDVETHRPECTKCGAATFRPKSPADRRVAQETAALKGLAVALATLVAATFLGLMALHACAGPERPPAEQAERDREARRELYNRERDEQDEEFRRAMRDAYERAQFEQERRQQRGY